MPLLSSTAPLFQEKYILLVKISRDKHEIIIWTCSEEPVRFDDDSNRLGKCGNQNCIEKNNISYFRICTRCSSYFCYQCCGLSHKILKLLNHRNDNCWFCPDCVKLALNAIFMDKDIEKKRQSYFSLLEPRIVDLEKQH